MIDDRLVPCSTFVLIGQGVDTEKVVSGGIVAKREDEA